MKRLSGYYCLTEDEYKEMGDYAELKKKYEDLLNLVARILPTEKETGDKLISRKDFIDLYDYMTVQMDLVPDFGKPIAVYGNDVTVHWHGLQCNCTDGALAFNHIIEGIRSLEEEEPEYYEQNSDNNSGNDGDNTD